MNPNIDNKLNELIGDAIMRQLSSVILPPGTTQDAVQRIIREFMRKHPEIFRFSFQYNFDKLSSTLYFKYNVTKGNKDSYARNCDCGPCPSLPSPSSCNMTEPIDLPKVVNNNTNRNIISYSPIESRIDSCNNQIPKSRSGIGAAVGKLFGGLFSRFASSGNVQGNEQEILNDINACLYAPAEVRHKDSFIIRVYMYLPQEQQSVDSKIKEIDPMAVKKEYKPLDLPVKEGDKLTVQLDLSDGIQCKNTIKSVIWKNHYTDCSFMARLVDPTQSCIDGTAYVFVNDMPAGEMLFTINVVDTAPRNLYTKVESHRYSKIFISYAHQDEDQVRGIAEGCKMLGKDYFFDRHTLQAGDIFKDKIINYIDNADLFVLCWSKNAAESEWVQIEREHALRLIQDGKSNLSIYPLCLRPEAPLPNDMSEKYNFGKL